MDLDLFNEHVWRILISARPRDSVSAVSKRIGLSYGWTYKWVNELAKEGVFKRKSKGGKGVELNEENRVYRRFLDFFRKTAEDSVSLHYSVLELFGLKYALTESDAVFAWTKGGYNVSRSRIHYPIFLKVKRDDLNLWRYYFKKLGFKASTTRNNAAGNGIFFVLRPQKDFAVEFVDGVGGVGGVPVVPLKEALRFMKKYEYNFSPALEAIGRERGFAVKKYAEASLYA